MSEFSVKWVAVVILVFAFLTICDMVGLGNPKTKAALVAAMILGVVIAHLLKDTA